MLQLSVMGGLRSRDLDVEWRQISQQRTGTVESVAHRVITQLLKSVAASLAAFAIDFAILVALTEAAGLHYLLSAGVSFLIGTTVSYVLSIAWVFPVRRFSSKAAEYLLYIAVGAVGLALNEALLWVFTEAAGIFYMASKVIAAALIFFWNFGARKLILFSAGAGERR